MRTEAVEILPGETFRTGEVRELFPVDEYLRAVNGRQYGVHPDGERFLMIRPLEPEALDVVYAGTWFDEVRERMGGSR